MESKIISSESGTMFVGPQAVDVFRAVMLKHALSLHVRTGGALRITRTATPTMLLKNAGAYTGKTYKRGQHAQALEDLTAYIETARAGIPVEAQ